LIIKKIATLIASLPTLLNKVMRFVGITLFALLPLMLYAALLFYFPPIGIWEILFTGYVGFKFFLPVQLFVINFIVEEL